MATRKNLRRTSRKTNRKTGRKGRASTRKNMNKKNGGIGIGSVRVNFQKIIGIKQKGNKQASSSHTDTESFDYVDVFNGKPESFNNTNANSDAKENKLKAMSFRSDALKSKPKRASKR